MSDDTTTPATDTVDTSAPEEGHAPAGEQRSTTSNGTTTCAPSSTARTRRSPSTSRPSKVYLTQRPGPRSSPSSASKWRTTRRSSTPRSTRTRTRRSQRVERLETEKQQAEEAAAEQARQDAVSDFIIAEVEKLQTSSGEELTDFEWRVVAQEAQRLQAESNARAPMVQEAWDALHGVYDQRLSKAFKGKPNRGRPPQGQSASKQPDLSKGSDRADYIDSKLQGWEYVAPA
jgi:hypothetical protein